MLQATEAAKQVEEAAAIAQVIYAVFEAENPSEKGRESDEHIRLASHIASYVQRTYKADMQAYGLACVADMLADAALKLGGVAK